MQAAAIISLASWTMIFSGALGGRIADRSGRGALMFYLCCGVGVAALLSLVPPLAFGLLRRLKAGALRTSAPPPVT